MTPAVPWPLLAFEPWGNYAIALAASVECLSVRPWTSTCSTPEILRLGVEASPEFACLSFKVTTGHFIKAALEGAEYGVMVNSVGTCRLHYYRMLQQKILRERGLKLYIFGLGYDGIRPPLIRYFDPPLLAFLRSSARARQKVLAVDDLELLAWRTRALEAHPGDTTRLLEQCLRELEAARRVGDVRRLRRGLAARFDAVRVDPEKVPLRVALVGEATILRDRFLNHGIEELLGSGGVQVRNFFLLGEEAKNIFHLGFMSEHSSWALRRLARPYLGSDVGGHALQSVGNMVRCARAGWDGIVHVAPSGCMPEVSVRPILRKISQDLDVPVLELSFDEHTSHVGIVTRVEAFVDILQERRKKRS